VDDLAIPVDDHGVEVGVVQDAVQHVVGEGDGVAPVDHRAPGDGVDGGGVDHHDDFGAARPWASAFGQRHQGVGAQEAVAFDRVRRAQLGGALGEQGVDGGGQPVVQHQPGLGVEPARQAPHPVPIHPLRQPGGPPLTFQTASTAVDLDPAHLHLDRTIQLGGGGFAGHLHQPIGPFDQGGT
jgi:hypothetical protein